MFWKMLISLILSIAIVYHINLDANYGGSPLLAYLNDSCVGTIFIFCLYLGMPGHIAYVIESTLYAFQVTKELSGNLDIVWWLCTISSILAWVYILCVKLFKKQ